MLQKLIIFSLIFVTNKSISKDIYTVRGLSMSPLLKPGTKVELISNSSEIHKNDIVLYNYQGNSVPIIKRVIATHQDTIKFNSNHLYISKIILKNTLNEIYQFTEKQINFLSNYIHLNKIPKDTVLIFSDNISYSSDSRKFGPVSIFDLIGKVKVKK